MSDTQYRPRPDDEVVVHETVEPRSRFGPFLAGALTVIVGLVIAVGVYLAVSDADDDGNIDVDVPAVDVDVDG